MTRLKRMKERGESPRWPPNPAPQITDFLFDIGPTVASDSGERSIEWSDFPAWQAMTGIELDVWEARTIRRLSRAFLAERHAAEKPDCPEPFALTGDEVTAIVAQARALPQTGSAEVAPTERLYIETMMLMAAADGEFDPSEVEVFADQFANHPAFAELLPQKAGAYMTEILSLLERDGVDARLAAITHGLADEGQRQNAFSLALEVCMADGLADPYEKELLRILAEQLTLSEEFVDAQIKQAMGAGA